jgi:hypothetical protein
MWAQVLACVLGIWLMIAPAVIGYSGAPAQLDYIMGPVAASIGYIAASEILRGLRYLNIITGAALLAIPLILSFAGPATICNLATGAALICCSLVRGRLNKHFGGGWVSLLHK